MVFKQIQKSDGNKSLQKMESKKILEIKDSSHYLEPEKFIEKNYHLLKNKIDYFIYKVLKAKSPTNTIYINLNSQMWITAIKVGKDLTEIKNHRFLMMSQDKNFWSSLGFEKSPHLMKELGKSMRSSFFKEVFYQTSFTNRLDRNLLTIHIEKTNMEAKKLSIDEYDDIYDMENGYDYPGFYEYPRYTQEFLNLFKLNN